MSTPPQAPGPRQGVRNQSKKSKGPPDPNKLTPVSMARPEPNKDADKAKREGIRAEVQRAVELPGILQNPMNVSPAGAQWEIKTFRLRTQKAQPAYHR